jgi:hypothetical protein
LTKHGSGATAHGRLAAGERAPFFAFPNERMFPEFPWQIWSVGWLAIFKGVLWLATDPAVPAALGERLAVKFLVAMVPWVVLGIGVWNRRRWAVMGAIGLAVLDLLFFAVYPVAWRYIAGTGFWGLSVILLVFNGPLGDVLILAAAPALWKHSGRRAGSGD